VSKQVNSIVIYNQQKRKCQLFFRKIEYKWQSRPYQEKKKAGACKGFPKQLHGFLIKEA
jgi:hypothetical protein